MVLLEAAEIMYVFGLLLICVIGITVMGPRSKL